MLYRARVAELVALLEGTQEAGRVYGWTRITGDWGRYIQLFRDAATGRISGWVVTRRAGRPDSPRYQETWLLIRFVGLQDSDVAADASEILFQESLDSAIAAFRDGPNLSWGEVADGLELKVIEERKFGPVVCHYAECEVVVSQYHVDV